MVLIAGPGGRLLTLFSLLLGSIVARPNSQSKTHIKSKSRLSRLVSFLVDSGGGGGVVFLFFVDNVE